MLSLVLLSILPSVFFRVIPWLVFSLSFFFPFIDVGMLKTERLRWGSPTATAPFALFWFCTRGLYQPLPLLIYIYKACYSFREIPC